MTRDLTAVEWLTGLVLGAASAIPITERVKTQGTISSPDGRIYHIGQKLGSTPCYNLYLCLLPNGRYGVLKIAIDRDHNRELETEAFVLKRLRTKAEEVEATRNPEEIPYNYHYFFPEVVESFVSAKQEGRRINILGFPEVIDKVSQLGPIANLTEKEHVYVDPKTGAWILGKTLKIVGFALEVGFPNRFLSGSNILIERELHGVTIFDWTRSLVYPGNVPEEVAREEIVQLGRSIVRVLGGNPETGKIPSSEQLLDFHFEEFLGFLVKGRFSDADLAHDCFYELIWSYWPHEFHPFTTYPLS